ncbi:MAG TPA: hypothetical protein VM056_00245 [Terriglobales bacterium]|nr:hypothetical protein [Terriglobales bacterium]
MTALYLILILSLLAILGVVAAVYFRIKKKIGLPPSETQQIKQRRETEEPVVK